MSNQLKKILLGALCVLLVMIGYVYVATDNSVPPKLPEAQSGMTGFTVINGITFVNSEDFNIACDGVYRTATNIAAGDSFSFALSLDRDATVSELLSQIGPGNDAYVVFYFDQKTQNWIEVGSNLFGATVSRVALNQFSSHVVPANTAVLVMTSNPVQKCFKPGQRNFSELEDVSGWSLKYVPKTTLVDNVRMAFEIPQGGVARELDMSSTKFLEKGLYWLFYDYSGEAERLDTKGVAFSQFGNFDSTKAFVTSTAGTSAVMGRFNFAAVDQDIDFMHLRLGTTTEAEFRRAVDRVTIKVTFEGNTEQKVEPVTALNFENGAAQIDFPSNFGNLVAQGTRVEVEFALNSADANTNLENAIAFGSGDPSDDDFFVTEAKALRPTQVVSSRLAMETQKLSENDRFETLSFDLPELVTLDGLDYANIDFNLGAGSEITSLKLRVTSDTFDQADQSVEVVAVIDGVETVVGTFDVDNSEIEFSQSLIDSLLANSTSNLFLKLNFDIQRLMPGDVFEPVLVAEVRALDAPVTLSLAPVAFKTPSFDLNIGNLTTYGESCGVDATAYLSFNKIDAFVQDLIEYENEVFGDLTTSEIQNYEFDINLSFDTLVGLPDLQLSSTMIRDGISAPQIDFEDRIGESITMQLARMNFADEFEALIYSVLSSHEEEFIAAGNNAFSFAELLDIRAITLSTPRSTMGYSIPAPASNVQTHDHPFLACSQLATYGAEITSLLPETEDTAGQNILQIGATTLNDFFSMSAVGLDPSKEVVVYFDLNDYLSHFLSATGFEHQTGVKSKKLHVLDFASAINFTSGFDAQFASVEDMINEIPNLSTIFAQQLVQNPRDFAASELGLVDLIRNRTLVNGLPSEFNVYIGNKNSNLIKTTISLDYLANLLGCVAETPRDPAVFANRLGHVESTFAKFDQAGCPKILNVDPAQVVVTGDATSSRTINLLPETAIVFKEGVFVDGLRFEHSVDNGALSAELQLVARIGEESSTVTVPFAAAASTDLNNMKGFLDRFAQLGEVSFEINLLAENNDQINIRNAELILDLVTGAANQVATKTVDLADYVQEPLISNYHNITPSGGVCSLESFEFEMYNNFIRSGNELIFQLYGDVDKYNFQLYTGPSGSQVQVRGVQLDTAAQTLSVPVSVLGLSNTETTEFEIRLVPLTGAVMNPGEYLELRSVSLAGRTLNFGNDAAAGFDNTLFPRMICGNTSLAVDPVSEVKDSLYDDTYVSHTVELDIREGSQLTKVTLDGTLVDEMDTAGNTIFLETEYADGIVNPVVQMLPMQAGGVFLDVTADKRALLPANTKLGVVFKLNAALVFSEDAVDDLEMTFEFANGDSYTLPLAEYSVDETDTDRDGYSNFLDADDDGDGLSDVLEGISTVDANNDGDLDHQDTDEDDIPDYLDDDSDNDGLDDDVELVYGTSVVDADTDSDGLNDGVEDADQNGQQDAGETDALNPDSDADGVLDGLEVTAGWNPLDDDTDSDDILDGVEDANQNGLVDDGETDPSLDDTDSDGLTDGVEDANKDGIVNIGADGVALETDPRNPDSDADGINDGLEGSIQADGTVVATSTDPRVSDTDGDGVNDGADNCQLIPNSDQANADSDEFGDACDTDTDGDTVIDSQDNCPDVANADQANDDDDANGNACDDDDDNDGLTDVQEDAIGTDPLLADSDADGISDFEEVGLDVNNPIDTDGDGDIDALDTDSDGDGLDDVAELAAGTNHISVDTDSDGIADNIEGLADTDNDDLVNARDLDSDGDGISDAIEAGQLPDDGIFDNAAELAASDDDALPDYLDPDSDGDGISDANEAVNLGQPVDSDGDGDADFRDTDSDNDGLDDNVEDANQNGEIDFTDNNADGVYNEGDFYTETDPRNADSDGDRIPDGVEGLADGLDGDGIVNALDLDSDGDGISDAIEAGANPAEPVDTDDDGRPDYLDFDSDGDSLPDAKEVEFGTDRLLDDTDGDGLTDFEEIGADGRDVATETDPLVADTDGDGLNDGAEETDNNGNPLLADTDGDGLSDGREVELGTDVDAVDSDGDGVNDGLEVAAGWNPLAADTDGDGLDDGVEDANQDGFVQPNETDPNNIDTDGDLARDDVDNCQLTPNADQADADTDDIGDVCEADTDADGVIDDLDNCPAIANPAQVNSDSDELGDVCDPDDDDDDLSDLDEQRIGTSTTNSDTDGDGFTDAQEVGDVNNPRNTDNADQIDALDDDSDNDGLSDEFERITAGFDAINDDIDDDGIIDGIDGTVDSDGDGSVNAQDTDSDNDTISDSVEGIVDTDNDGIADYIDRDSDNDGIIDSIEGNIDTDSDGVADFRSTDSDGDGLRDNQEDKNLNGVQDLGETDARNADSDNDGFEDGVEVGPNPAEPIDRDGDGIIDALESNILDTNGNGILDHIDFDIAQVKQFMQIDTDADGVVDYLDMFVADASEQFDFDFDGIGDNADTDDDNDGVPDADDDCERTSQYYSEAQRALNVQGCLDLDTDGFYARDVLTTGAALGYDNCDSVFNVNQTDSNRDGKGDACDATELIYQVAAGETVTIGLADNSLVDNVTLDIDWGDNSDLEEFTTGNVRTVSHTFENGGTFTVSMQHSNNVFLSIYPCSFYYHVENFHGNGDLTLRSVSNVGLFSGVRINHCNGIDNISVDSNKMGNSPIYIHEGLSLDNLELFDETGRVNAFDFFASGSDQGLFEIESLFMANFRSVRGRSMFNLAVDKFDASELDFVFDTDEMFNAISHVNLGDNDFSGGIARFSDLPTYYCSNVDMQQALFDAVGKICLPPKDFYQLP